MTNRPKEELADSTPSHITDHPFIPGPRGWFDTCGQRVPDPEEEGTHKNCGLAEAAHQETTVVRTTTRWRDGGYLDVKVNGETVSRTSIV